MYGAFNHVKAYYLFINSFHLVDVFALLSIEQRNVACIFFSCQFLGPCEQFQTVFDRRMFCVFVCYSTGCCSLCS